MSLDVAANIAWCLMGSVIVGAVLMYGYLDRLVQRAYQEGRQDSLGRVVPATHFGEPVAPLDQALAGSPHPATESAA